MRSPVGGLPDGLPRGARLASSSGRCTGYGQHGRHKRSPLLKAGERKEGIVMVRTCECGLATTDPAFLERHLLTAGHHEHVAWPVADSVVPNAVLN